MESIFGRITRPFSDLEPIIRNWPADKVIFYQHDADGKTRSVHCHFVMINAKPRDRVFEQKWWKEFGLKGNKDFSFKALDPKLNPYVYMAKGKLTPVYNNFRSEEDLAADRQSWVNPEKKTEIVFVTNKSTKVTNYTIAKEAIGLWRSWALENNYYTMEEEKIDWLWDYKTKKKLVDIVADLCAKHKKGRYYRNVSQICQDAICEIAPHVWREKILSMF